MANSRLREPHFKLNARHEHSCTGPARGTPVVQAPVVGHPQLRRRGIDNKRWVGTGGLRTLTNEQPAGVGVVDFTAGAGPKRRGPRLEELPPQAHHRHRVQKPRRQEDAEPRPRATGAVAKDFGNDGHLRTVPGKGTAHHLRVNQRVLEWDHSPRGTTAWSRHRGTRVQTQIQKHASICVWGEPHVPSKRTRRRDTLTQHGRIPELTSAAMRKPSTASSLNATICSSGLALLLNDNDDRG